MHRTITLTSLDEETKIPPAEANLVQERDEPQSKPKRYYNRIAIVDDDPALVVLITQFLHQEGLQAFPAVGPSQMQDMISSGKLTELEMAIIDYVMPGMNGVELARRIVEYKPDVRILITSAYPPSEREARQAGFDFIAKPFLSKELLHKVRSMLQQRDATLQETNAGALPAVQ